MRYAIYTLGCKVNQYETQAMETILTGRGHTLMEFDAEADVYIINTCSVTAVSDKKCRNMIRRTKRAHPDALIAVCGCYAQAKPEEVAGLEVDLVAGTGDRMAFLDQVEQATLDRSTAWVSVDNALKRHDFEVLPAGGLVGRTRAMLKVEDGCGNFCTYCIIPFTRGPVRSESIDAAVTQAKALAEAGYHEIVLTGIEISSWGQDLEGDVGSSLLCRPRPAGAAGQFGAPHHHRGFLPSGVCPAQPLPPLPSVPPVGQQCHLETDEPKVHGGAIFGELPSAASVF